MIGKFSVFNMAKAYSDNKDLIHSYMKKQPIENYDDTKVNGTVMGLSIGLFVLLFLVLLAIWIWAIVVLVKYWNVLPTWAKVLGLIGILTGIGGPVMTLIVVYIGKEEGK